MVKTIKPDSGQKLGVQIMAQAEWNSLIAAKFEREQAIKELKGLLPTCLCEEFIKGHIKRLKEEIKAINKILKG